MSTLQWRNNECNGVSNHQPRDCLLNHLFKPLIKETSKFRVTGLCEGNSPVTGKFPAQRASISENVSFWWRHHDLIHLLPLAAKLIIPINFHRSRTTSASPEQPITFDNNIIHENNGGDPPSYMNSAVEGDSTPGDYVEILEDFPVDASQVGPYEEISDVVTDRPNVQDSNTYEPLRHETSKSPGLYYNVHNEDTVAASVAPKNTQSPYENVHWSSIGMLHTWHMVY